MSTKTTTHGDMLRAHADIEDYRSRGDFTSQYLRDAAGIIDAQAEEIERLRSIHQDIGGIGGCADGSGMRAVAAVADANERADKAQSRVVELEGRLREATSLLRDLLEVEGAESYGEHRASIMAVLAKLSAE